MPLDLERFENLSCENGAGEIMRFWREEVPDSAFLDYFKMNASTMDMFHLELALGFLSKIGSDAAHREVAKYLEHASFSVRLTAVRVVAKLTVVDDYLMSCVVESLEKHAGDPLALAQELRVALDRPANEAARNIVSQYRERSGPQMKPLSIPQGSVVLLGRPAQLMPGPSLATRSAK